MTYRRERTRVGSRRWRFPLAGWAEGAEVEPSLSIRIPRLPPCPPLPDDVRAHRDWLLSLVDLPAGGTFVDLGCGRGEDVLARAALRRFMKPPR